MGVEEFTDEVWRNKEFSFVVMEISHHVKKPVSVLEVYDFAGIQDLTPKPTVEILVV